MRVIAPEYDAVKKKKKTNMTNSIMRMNYEHKK
jgi:hypothetical protein